MKTKNHQTANGNRMPSRVVRRNVTALILRSILFLTALAAYLLDKTLIENNIYQIGFTTGSLLLAVIWIFFVSEMVSRFFPSDSESMGCQKQFARNFVPNDTLSTPIADMKRKHRKSVVIVAAVWIIPNAGIAALFFIGIIDAAPFSSSACFMRCAISCASYFTARFSLLS
jgi:hypothetical protein